jgi:hypothetical protein
MIIEYDHHEYEHCGRYIDGRFYCGNSIDWTVNHNESGTEYTSMCREHLIEFIQNEIYDRGMEAVLKDLFVSLKVALDKDTKYLMESSDGIITIYTLEKDDIGSHLYYSRPVYDFIQQVLSQHGGKEWYQEQAEIKRKQAEAEREEDIRAGRYMPTCSLGATFGICVPDEVCVFNEKPVSLNNLRSITHVIGNKK